MNKFIISIVIILVVAGGYFLWGEKAQAPVSLEPQALEQRTPKVPAHMVSYTDNGYTPSVIIIKTGESITFKNDSSKAMWPASAMHPTHIAYPTTGGCLGSTFDACAGIQPGKTWSFTFDIPGAWKYHDHLTPTFFGAITVE
ncbi:MAG: hypothetical protein HYZ69_01585 [Candidatus Colwellbacteria bacterium]|nr:hypothetical protein [Candidatus Colwellbacteria bacterium]